MSDILNIWQSQAQNDCRISTTNYRSHIQHVMKSAPDTPAIDCLDLVTRPLCISAEWQTDKCTLHSTIIGRRRLHCSIRRNSLANMHNSPFSDWSTKIRRQVTWKKHQPRTTKIIALELVLSITLIIIYSTTESTDKKEHNALEVVRLTIHLFPPLLKHNKRLSWCLQTCATRLYVSQGHQT